MITFFAAIIVLASIGMVSWPLIRGGKAPKLVEDFEVSELLAQKDAALFAISELESDYEMGNLSQGDYQELRKKYEEKAVALLKTMDELRSERSLDTVNNIDEEIEARVSRLRAGGNATGQEIEEQVPERGGANDRRVAVAGKSCPGCGARLEADDRFCFHCGAALNPKCPKCSADTGFEDRFCPHCGTTLGEQRIAGSGRAYAE